MTTDFFINENKTATFTKGEKVVIAPTLEVWGNYRKLCVAKIDIDQKLWNRMKQNINYYL